AKAYVLTGTLKDEQTVILDQALPLTSGRFRLTLEPLPPESRKPYQEVVAAIRQRQSARGHQPLTREAVDTSLTKERENWDELEQAAGPRLKDLLLAESPGAAIPAPPRRNLKKTKP